MSHTPRRRAEPQRGRTDDLDASPEARRRRLARNIAWNYLSGFISIFGLILLYPFAVSIAGAEAYGLWVLIFGTVQLLSTADFGLGTGVVRQLGALLRDNAGYSERSRFVTVAMTLFVALSAAMTALYLIGFPLYLQTIPVRDAVRDSEVAAVMAGAFALAITVVARGANAILWAEDRQDIERKCSVIGMVLRVIGYVAAAATHAGLHGVVLAEVASLSVTPVICCASVVRRYPRPDFARAGFATYVKPLVSLSSILFVGSLASLISFQLPLYIVGASLGLAATAAFGAVMRVYQSCRLLVSWVANPFIQQIASAEREELADRVRQCYVLAVSLGTVVSVGIAALAHDIVAAWLGESFAFAAPALALVSVGILAESINQPSALVVNLRGNPWRASLLGLGGLALTVAAIIPAQHSHSLTWVMAATVLAPAALAPVYWRYAVRELSQDPFQARRRQQVIFVLVAVALGLVLTSLSSFLPPWPALAAAGAVVGIPGAAGLVVLRGRRRGSNQDERVAQAS